MSDFSIGEKLKVTLFGQSHGPAIGCVMEGFPAGQKIDGDFVAAFMARRAPGQNAWSTPRKEADQPEILSGLNADGLTCGAPITAVIRNGNTRSGDYEALKDVPRPGHADYTARVKYGNAWDGRGGGQFSARLTAPLCFAGALCVQWLAEKGVYVTVVSPFPSERSQSVLAAGGERAARGSARQRRWHRSGASGQGVRPVLPGRRVPNEKRRGRPRGRHGSRPVHRPMDRGYPRYRHPS